MRLFIATASLLFTPVPAQDMIVRVYVSSWQDLVKIDEKSQD